MVRTVLFSWGYLLLVRQFSSVAQLCPTLCDPMDCRMSGFPVHHKLPKLALTHVHRVGNAIQQPHPSNLIPFASCLQSFPISASFPMSQFFGSDGQSIGVSASTSVLPMNIRIDFLYLCLLIRYLKIVVQFSSVAQSCPTLCDPMNHSMPGLPVHHQLLEFTQTHVH